MGRYRMLAGNGLEWPCQPAAGRHKAGWNPGRGASGRGRCRATRHRLGRGCCWPREPQAAQMAGGAHSTYAGLLIDCWVFFNPAHQLTGATGPGTRRSRWPPQWAARQGAAPAAPMSAASTAAPLLQELDMLVLHRHPRGATSVHHDAPAMPRLAERSRPSLTVCATACSRADSLCLGTLTSPCTVTARSLADAGAGLSQGMVRAGSCEASMPSAGRWRIVGSPGDMRWARKLHASCAEVVGGGSGAAMAHCPCKSGSSNGGTVWYIYYLQPPPHRLIRLCGQAVTFASYGQSASAAMPFWIAQRNTFEKSPPGRWVS